MARPLKRIIKTFVGINRTMAEWLIRYFPKQFGSNDHHQTLLDIIKADLRERDGKINVLEIGGIDRPLLARHERMRYDGLDVDRNDLCDVLYDNFYQQSAEREFPQQCQQTAKVESQRNREPAKVHRATGVLTWVGIS